jgi:Poxvirus A32 protein
MPLDTIAIPSESRAVDKRFLKLKDHGLLPNPCGDVILCMGATGSGKSSFIWSLLNHWMKNYFDEVIIFTGTADSVATWEKLMQRNVVVLNGYDDGVFREYLDDLEKEQVKRRNEGKYERRVCVMFDDMVADGISRAVKPTALDRLCLTSRHLHVMTIIASQKFRGLLSPALRNNIHWLVLYRMPKADLGAIADEYGEPLVRDDFIKLAETVYAKRPHNYLVIKTRQAGGAKFWDSINAPIEL